MIIILKMNKQEILLKKLIFKFAIMFNDLEKNSYVFNSYRHYVQQITNYYYYNKFNQKNKNVSFLLNIDHIFTKNCQAKPIDFLTCGLDFEDETLIEYFNDLII